MKYIPVTILPLILVAIVAYLFAFVVPSGQDLISDTMDTLLGVFTGVLLVVCIGVDIARFYRPSRK